MVMVDKRQNSLQCCGAKGPNQTCSTKHNAANRRAVVEPRQSSKNFARRVSCLENLGNHDSVGNRYNGCR